MKLRGKIC